MAAQGAVRDAAPAAARAAEQGAGGGRPAAPGTVVIRSRAFEHVFAALAARTLGVAPGAVAARIGDARGLVTVDIRAPYSARDRSVVATAAEVQRVIRDEGGALSGAHVGEVTVRITGVVPTPRRRLS